ncbi:AbrB/MazE/SpoVT family DNA-binding domain-containing protein [bacterium]|nr:AbrB/MazE/SpoVT family DNA-binding domain-containing protein [bacterium]
MPIAKIRKGALTIPVEIRRKANLEDGTFISIEYNPDDGFIILKPELLIDQKDYVILSEKEKEMIEEALQAEKNGDVVGPFSNIEEALKALKES